MLSLKITVLTERTLMPAVLQDKLDDLVKQCLDKKQRWLPPIVLMFIRTNTHFFIPIDQIMRCTRNLLLIVCVFVDYYERYTFRARHLQMVQTTNMSHDGMLNISGIST